MKNDYIEKSIDETRKKLSSLVFVNEQGREQSPSEEQVQKMLELCKKRNNPSYYKLRHASGLDESYAFKAVNMYSDDGKKMRRFESGLRVNF